MSQEKKQTAQNKVIRFINSLGPRSTVTADILGEKDLLNLLNSGKATEIKTCAYIF